MGGGLSASAAACGPAPDDDAGDRFAAASQVALPRDTMDLSGNLARLAGLIQEARETEGEALFAAVREAEAVTDRLLETAPPVAWLPEQYSVDATLRQFQALADRVVARLRRGATAADVADELAGLAASVARLREVLEEGSGGAAPARLDSLLDDDEANRRSPVEVFGGVRVPRPRPVVRPDSGPPPPGLETDSAGP